MYYDPNRSYHSHVYSWHTGSIPSYVNDPHTYHPPYHHHGDPAYPLHPYGSGRFVSSSTPYHQPVPVPKRDMAIEDRNENSNKNAVYFGRTPDEWITHTDFLVNEGMDDVKRGINATHILQEFILMGVLVGKGYAPEKAYKTVEEWERTGASKLLQQSKNM
ncbi:hypothetical protein [Rossellomorea marisflavi]|uniref:hypothetical protein n=1 Tax=Rossellomorea marisflavi TaxID=189381 RepID=UPI00397A8EF8